MKGITCERCKIYLGILASGSRIRSGTVHMCGECGKLIIAEAFKRKEPDYMQKFNDIFGGFKK